MWQDLLRGAIESSTNQLVVRRGGAEIWSLPGQNGDALLATICRPLWRTVAGR